MSKIAPAQQSEPPNPAQVAAYRALWRLLLRDPDEQKPAGGEALPAEEAEECAQSPRMS